MFVKRSFLATALSVLEDPSSHGAKSWVPVEAAEYGPSGGEAKEEEIPDTPKQQQQQPQQQQPHAVSSSSSPSSVSSFSQSSASSSSSQPPSFDLAAQCDAGHGEEQCDWRRQRYGAGALCSDWWRFFSLSCNGVVLAAGRAFRQGPLGSLRHQEGGDASRVNEDHQLETNTKKSAHRRASGLGVLPSTASVRAPALPVELPAALGGLAAAVGRGVASRPSTPQLHL